MFKHLLILLTSFFLSGNNICPKTEVCFTPGGNCSQIIIDSINHANKSILIQAYTFTSKQIAESLIKAKKRGIDIKIIFDESQTKSKHSVINQLFKNYIPIWIDFIPAIAHSKIIIIDNKKIITGSFNFSNAAQKKNAENLLIITGDKTLIKKYIENWEIRKSKSMLYKNKTIIKSK